MNTIYYPDSTLSGQRFAATIGFFDGVHRGHRAVIGQLQEEAARRGLLTMVITFESHPRQVLQSNWQPQLLTTLEEKKALLATTGIDQLVVLRFDRQMAAWTARTFMQRLKADLGVALLLTGYDNRFGHDRNEGFRQYEQYGHELGITVVSGRPLTEGDMRFSSSLARRLLQEGRVEQACQCLGRPYTIQGSVVHGHQIGRTLGFPTANILLNDAHRLLPAFGVYAVQTDIDGKTYRGVMNIGTRPTFGGHHATLEVFIFDFDANLYQQSIIVSFIGKIRDEQHFQSPDELVEQMKKDTEQAKQILSEYEADTLRI